MGPSRLFLWLFVMSILASTWARAFSEVSGANVARGHLIKIGDESIGSSSINDHDVEYYREIVRRYIEERSDESLIKDVERIERKSRSLVGNDEKRGIPYSEKRWQKMLDKAIYKIIMGDLSTADILLLKSLNYNLEEVLAIREREFAKKIGISERPIDKIGKIGKIDRDSIDSGSSTESYRSNYLEDKADRFSSYENRRTTIPISSTRKKNRPAEKIDDDFDFEAYNRQAVYDYENTASNASQQSELEPISPIVDPIDDVETVESDDDVRKNFDRAMESHVVFKIRYDDSEFDSRSDERSRQLSRERGLGSVRGRPHYDVEFPGKSQVGQSKVESEESVSPSSMIDRSVSSAATENRRNDTFLESTDDLRYSIPLVYRLSDLVVPTEIGGETTIDADFLVEDRNDSLTSVRSVVETANASSSEIDESKNDRYEKDLSEKDRYEKDRHEKDRYEKDRSEKDRSEKDRSEKDRSEKDHSEKDRSEKDRSEKDRSEKDRSEKDRSEKDRSEKDRSEKDRSEKDRSEKDRSEKDRLTKNERYQEDRSAKIDRYDDRSAKNDLSSDTKRISPYEGLEWVEDDVYRVIPGATDSLDYDGNAIYLEKIAIDNDDGNETRGFGVDPRIGDEDNNDTTNYQNDDSGEAAQGSSTNSSARNQSSADLSAYQQLAMAHRRDNLTSAFDSQGQKAIEDIKLKVLAMTGRFNLSSSSNQVQRERLTLFSPVCQAPRNTDPEAWSDPFSMNMYFQLNLTSGDHVVAAKLRIYKLPQNNVTLPNSAAAEEEDEEEKKIRISVYFYTKSLKKHRSKKRLMDSVVTALTTEGNHLALDVRQAIRFWRQNLRSSHGSSSNHGLVIQVEDQDGRPLKPSQYIERDTCHDTERNEDDKINESLHSSFKPVIVTFVS